MRIHATEVTHTALRLGDRREHARYEQAAVSRKPWDAA